MYLENSEQSEVSGEGESSTGSTLENQCEVLKPTDGADSTSTAEDAAALGLKVFVEYTAQLVSSDMERSLPCLEHQTSRHVAEGEPYRNGHTESLDTYSAGMVLLESDQILDECETLGLSQPFHTCLQQFNCLESSVQSANHSVACYKCCPCCEQSAEHLGLFQQCQACGQQSLGFERDIMILKCKDFEVCESSHLISGESDLPNSFQQEENCDQQSEGWDSETPTEESDSGDGDFDVFQNEIESTNCDDQDDDDDDNKDVDEENCLFEQNDTEATLSEDDSLDFIPADCDGDDPVSFDGERCEEFQETFELPEPNPGVEMSTGHCGNDDFETSVAYEARQYVASEKTSDGSEFCTEEDSFSDCSSIETKSFQTCRDDSITSEPCSDSSGESEKGAQEDSSDDQTQWESFEDFDEMEQSRAGEVKEDKPRSPVVDVVIEDHFDLFDRADYYGHVFAPRRQYVSCFEGGDVHESLYLQEVADRRAKSFCACEEDEKKINPLEKDACPEEAHDGTAHECSRTDGDSETSPDDSSLEEEIDGEPCVFHAENYEEDDEDDLDWEAYAFEDRASASSNDDNEEDEEEEENEGEEEEDLSAVSEENMYAPCADDISVEGDAYEDFCENLCNECDDECDETDATLCTVGECAENAYIELCSEMELHWSLVDQDVEGELYNPGVEDYYAYQIKSIQMSLTELSDALLLNTFKYEQVICAEEDVSVPSNEIGDEHPDQRESESQASGVCVAASDGITVISEHSEISASESEEHETAADAESENDSWLKGQSADVVCPQDVIYSVLSKPTRTGEDEENGCEPRSDFEEEQSDDDSCDTCDCDHCIPPEVQVPTEPLLPQTSDDTGKICVVIDLDETLVHSSFKPVNNPDFIIPVELDGSVYQVYVLKRPHVDEFLSRMGELFECVLFTASLAKYADPVSDLLDKSGAFQSRLFRESCVFHKGNYVKDLSRLGRDLKKVIIIDNSPASYVFHPENAIAVESWFDDQSDTELLDLIPFFESLSEMDDVYDKLRQQKTSS